MTSARDIIQRFGAVESDQRYGRLLDVFTDDAVYCDPIMGVQSGRDQIAAFKITTNRGNASRQQ